MVLSVNVFVPESEPVPVIRSIVDGLPAIKLVMFGALDEFDTMIYPSVNRDALSVIARMLLILDPDSLK